jgi:tetratricopeptide (TPR) repeat protein
MGGAGERLKPPFVRDSPFLLGRFCRRTAGRSNSRLQVGERLCQNHENVYTEPDPMVRRVILSAFAACLLLSAAAMGQGRPTGPPVAPPGQMSTAAPGFGNSATVTVAVTDETGLPLDEQALVKLTSDMTGANLWGTTQDRSQIIFDNLVPAEYEIEVSAAGYSSVTKNVNVMSPNENFDVLVRMRRSDGGASPVGLPGQLLVGKARQEAQKGIAALSSGNLKEAQKHLEKAYKIAPGNADLNYLMAILCSRTSRTGEEETYLNKAVTANNKHVRALTMLGELRLQQKDYKGAIASLEQAVSADPGFWTAHWLLAQAYLKNGDFEKSSKEAELAIQKGKAAANGAQLVRGEALANLGRTSDAIRALQDFLQLDPQSPAADPVRKMIGQLQSAQQPTYAEAAMPLGHALPPALPAAGAPDAGGVSIPTWHPPSVDDEKPPLAAGAVCPASEVLRRAGRSAEQLVDNISRFNAIEYAVAEQLDATGKPLKHSELKFDYTAEISEPKQGWLAVDEYRTPFSDQGDFPDHIATRGIPALALVFHPALRDDYEMTCEGLGSWKGLATWVVYFRQRPDKPARFLSYTFTDGEYRVGLKGRAWIAASNYQIVHLEADLLNPLPKIQLRSQHQSVDYGPVLFKKSHIQLWLPKTAELYFDFRHRFHYRRESFENYKLFSVGTMQKIGLPKTSDDSDKSQPPLP